MLEKIKKYGGIVLIVAGSAMCYLGGTSESSAIALVGGVFAFIAVIVAAVKG